MSRIMYLLLFATILSCVNADVETNDKELAMVRARFFCNTSAEEMEWLRTIIILAETNIELKGDILALRLDNQPIFVHQPILMSCLGCIVYTCEGERIENASLDTEKLMTGIENAKVIYRSVY